MILYRLLGSTKMCSYLFYYLSHNKKYLPNRLPHNPKCFPIVYYVPLIVALLFVYNALVVLRVPFSRQNQPFVTIQNRLILGNIHFFAIHSSSNVLMVVNGQNRKQSTESKSKLAFSKWDETFSVKEHV